MNQGDSDPGNTSAPPLGQRFASAIQGGRISPNSPTLSGRAAVVPFVVILILGLLFVLSIAVQFQRIMTQLDRSRSVWPRAQLVLADRYRNANDFLVTNRFLANPISITDWRNQQIKFHENVQFDRQVESAIELEKMLRSFIADPKTASEAQVTLATSSEDLEKLVESERLRNAAQTSFLGRWTMFFLRLKTPPVFLP
jgi:hypothetical protein